MPDPSTPLTERTPEEVADYIDDHLIMALAAADHMYADHRFAAEDHLRNRLVALSDSWDPRALKREESTRTLARLDQEAGQVESWSLRPPEKGVWRHPDGSPCISYPDSLNFAYVPPQEQKAHRLVCPHGQTLVCERIEGP